MSHVKRWAVTYTKHVKQKRKVYQDGALELNASARKVMLYDDDNKLIDSRSVKNDEIIEVGGSLAFEVHLVDIGNLEANNKKLENCCVNDANFKPVERTGKQGKGEILQHSNLNKLPKNVLSNGLNCTEKEPLSSENKSKVLKRTPFNSLNTVSNSFKEWDVLYTSQITQKAKRYHDGILRVKQCDSHTNQVILVSEDGAVLSNKYLKSIESVKSGSNCDFPNYLVEICEPRLPPVENTKRPPPKQIQTSSCSNNFKLTSTCRPQESYEKPPTEIPTSNCSNNIKLTSTCELQEDKQKDSFEQTVDSTITNFIWGQQASKPLRDVCGILSTLKKPLQQDKHCDNKIVGKRVDPSPSSDLIFFNVENQRSTELSFPMKNFSQENVDASDKSISAEGATQEILCKMSINSQSRQMEQTSDVKDLRENYITFKTSGGGPRGSHIISLHSNNEGNPSLLSITKDASDVSRQSSEENEAADSTNDFYDMSHPGASRVDPIIHQIINQVCRNVQELDTVSDHSDFAILSNGSVYADDIPTFELGF